MKMGNQPSQSTANPKVLNPSSPSSSAQGNEVTSGSTEEAHTDLLIINSAILISFFFPASEFLLLTMLRKHVAGRNTLDVTEGALVLVHSLQHTEFSLHLSEAFDL